MRTAIPHCELSGCNSTGRDKAPVGLYMVWDDGLDGVPKATISRPAWMCSACVDFAVECGMRPERMDIERKGRTGITGPYNIPVRKVL